MSDPSPKKKKQSSGQYDRLLQGKITSKQYVQTLRKQAKSGRYATKPRSASA